MHILTLVVRIGGQPLDTALPFVKDNTGAWIPLELLTFEGLQPLLSFGHRNEAIRGEVRRFLKAGGVTMLFELADDLIARCGLLDTSTVGFSITTFKMFFGTNSHSDSKRETMA